MSKVHSRLFGITRKLGPPSKGIRQIGLQRFPYAIIYGLSDDDAVILAIAHLHRRAAYWKSRTGGD